MAVHELKDQAVVLDSLSDCLQQASTVIVTTPDPVYRALTAADFAPDGRQVTVVDCWRMLGAELEHHPRITYVPIGRSVDDTRNAERLAALWTAGSPGK
jgi:hypothetical protein